MTDDRPPTASELKDRQDAAIAGQPWIDSATWDATAAKVQALSLTADMPGDTFTRPWSFTPRPYVGTLREVIADGEQAVLPEGGLQVKAGDRIGVRRDTDGTLYGYIVDDTHAEQPPKPLKGKALLRARIDELTTALEDARMLEAHARQRARDAETARATAERQRADAEAENGDLRNAIEAIREALDTIPTWLHHTDFTESPC